MKGKCLSISVIIPVFNAEKFLSRAIDSALSQPEVSEILLVDDLSPDNSLEICIQYQKEYPDKIKLFQHEDKKNHGAGAARNLGIINAKSEYIAFLDADDYYLPDRFKVTCEIFSESPLLDGVYGALGANFESEEAKKYNIEDKFSQPTGLWANTHPEVLFEVLVQGKYGHFHLNTLTVKKELIEKAGLFNEKLRQGQDKEWLLRLSLNGYLMRLPNNDIIAIRGVHENNRIHNSEDAGYYHMKLVPEFLKWGEDNPRVIKNIDKLIRNSYLMRTKQYCKAKYGKSWLLHYLYLGLFDKNMKPKYKFKVFFIMIKDLINSINLIPNNLSL